MKKGFRATWKTNLIILESLLETTHNWCPYFLLFFIRGRWTFLPILTENWTELSVNNRDRERQLIDLLFSMVIWWILNCALQVCVRELFLFVSWCVRVSVDPVNQFGVRSNGEQFSIFERTCCWPHYVLQMKVLYKYHLKRKTCVVWVVFSYS